MGDLFRDLRQSKKLLKEKYGRACPLCSVKFPKGNPTILLPQQICKVCGFRDPRTRIEN